MATRPLTADRWADMLDRFLSVARKDSCRSMPGYHDDGPLLGLLLRLASQRWGTEMDGALESLGVTGVTSAHARVIPFVPPGGATIQELAQRANVRKQTMAQSVDQLVASGYVERRPDPNDRRATIVRLTAKGRQLRPRSHEAGARVERAWAAEIGSADLETLRAILTKLVDVER